MENDGQRLWTAVEEDDEEEVSKLLDANPTVLEGRDKGSNFVHLAAEYGRLGVLRLLVEKGANIDAGRRHNALHGAARKGHEEVMAFLLSKGARADKTNLVGATPLMLASGSGHVGVVRMLLQHVGEQGLATRHYFGGTALHMAAEGGRQEVVKYLLVAGAQTTIRDNEGRTPRTVAEEAAFPGCVRVFDVS